MLRKENSSQSALKNLESNDLIYGHTKERVKIISDYSTEFFIDVYNHAMLQPITCNHHLPGLIQIAYIKSRLIECPKHFNKAAYEFNSFCSQFEDPKIKGDSYFNISLHDLEKDNIIPMIKKRCKLGMLWSLSKGGSIHFILDGINYEACFKDKQVRYTYAELRFAYRNWSFLKEYHIAGKCNFYCRIDNKLKPVEAPWEADPSIVESYKPKHSRAVVYASFFKQLKPGDSPGTINEIKPGQSQNRV